MRAAILVLLVALPSPAPWWLRGHVEDAILVERSELIVLGHLQPGSVEVVAHKGGGSHEHTATLLVSEVIKGKADATEFRVIIHYGLCPVVGGRGCGVNLQGNRRDYPKDLIEVVDTGGDGGLLATEASEDNVWFLRRKSRVYAKDLENGDYGIIDPDELRPKAHRRYFEAYLAKNAEERVRDMLPALPKTLTDGAQRFLDHCEVQRIAALEDRTEWAKRLVPFLLKGHSWDHKAEARDAMVKAGEAAGPVLLELFKDPGHKEVRGDVIQIWGELKWRGGVEPIAKLLGELDDYWAGQKVKGSGWWNDDVTSELTRTRRENYGLVHVSVIALGRIGDPDGRAALEATLARWKAIDFSGNPQIVEQCERGLKAMRK